MVSLIKIINRYSLIFAIINFIMANMRYEDTNSLLFIWICFISFCIYILNDIKSKKVLIPVAAAFYPYLGVNNFNDALVITAILVYCLYFTFKGIVRSDYEEAISEIKTSLIVLLVLILLSIVSFNTDVFERVSWYYIVIFIISSVLYLRMQRSLKLGLSDGKIQNQNYINYFEKRNKRLNFISTIIMCIFTTIISIREVRDAIIRSLALLYSRLIEIFIFVFSGAMCSLIDKVFWNGSLDYIELKGFFTFDLKDVYVNVSIGLLLFFMIKGNKKIKSILEDKTLMKGFTQTVFHGNKSLRETGDNSRDNSPDGM
jgi:hypothetical protein